MSELALPYSYARLPIKDADWLRTKVGAIRLLYRQTATNVLHIGNHLLEVRAFFVHPTPFWDWVLSEVAVSPKSVTRFMRAAEAFHGLTTSDLDRRFDPVALYELAEPKAPVEARDIAISLARDGQQVTRATARDIILAVKHGADPADVKNYKRVRKLVDTTFKPARPSAEDKSLSVMAWEAFKAVVEQGDLVKVSRVLDEVGNDDYHAAPVQLTVYPSNPAEQIRSFTSGDGLETLVIMAAGREPLVECTKCKKALPQYTCFSRKEGNTHGRATSCRRCEVERVTAAKKRQKDRIRAACPSLFPTPAPPAMPEVAAEVVSSAVPADAHTVPDQGPPEPDSGCMSGPESTGPQSHPA